MSGVASGEPIHWRVQPEEDEYIDLDDVEIVDDDDELGDEDDDFEEELREGRNGAERALE